MDNAAQPLRPSWALLVATFLVLAACEIGMAGCWAATMQLMEERDQNSLETAGAILYLALGSSTVGGVGLLQYFATFRHSTTAACIIAGFMIVALLIMSSLFIVMCQVSRDRREVELTWWLLLAGVMVVGFIAAIDFTWARRLERTARNISQKARQMSMAEALLLMTLLGLQFGIASFLLRLAPH